MTTGEGPRARLARQLTRLPVSVPLVVAFAGFAALYIWQALDRAAPTIFSDELEMTQISRAIAETGHPERRGVAYGFTTLVPWLTAPFWWLGSVSAAFDGIKVFQALVMTAAIFPAYGIARLVVSRRWAVAAAVLSIATPALSYAPILKEEPFAYTAAATAVFLTMRAFAKPTRRSILIALAATIVAATVREQLAVLLVVYALSLGVLAWRTDRLRLVRSTWSRREWAVAITLGGLASIAALGVAALVWDEIERAATELLGQTWEYGVWAAGAWATGIALAPAIAISAALARPRARYMSSPVLAFTVVGGLTVAGIVAYAAIKAAVISTVLGPLIVERNVMYLTPLAMAALVSILANRDTPWWAIAASGAAWLYLVSQTPLRLDVPYYESHGVAIGAFAKGELGWSAGTIEDVLTAAGAAAVALFILIGILRRHTMVATAIGVVVVAGVAAWGLTAEIHADEGERKFAAFFASRIPHPQGWIDDATQGGAVTILGQEMGGDPTDLWLTEFWNRHVKQMWSVDGTAPGPGPTLTPDLASPDGTLTPRAGTKYVLALSGVDPVGTEIAARGGARILEIEDGLLKLRSSQTGIGEGSWTGPRAAFNRFDVDPTRKAVASVTVGRTAFCAPQAEIPSEVVVRIGPLIIGADRQPAVGRITYERRVRVVPCATVTLDLPAPRMPWRVEIESDTFVPHEIDPSLTDQRQLGVQAALSVGPAPG